MVAGREPGDGRDVQETPERRLRAGDGRDAGPWTGIGLRRHRAAGTVPVCGSYGAYEIDVYYSWDYPGFLRRTSAMVVDVLVSALGLAAVSVRGTMLLASLGAPPLVRLATGVLGPVAVVCYLTVLKRSHLATLGYRLADCRVVNTCSDIPSLWQMVVRLAVAGAVDPLVNLLYTTQSSTKQTLADEITGTVVVRRHARPFRRVRRVFRYLFFLRCTFIVSEPSQESTLPGASR